MANLHPTSAQLFEAAKTVIPGGVNSPVRAFQAVGGTPRFIESAKGAYITDVDGQSYIDYIGSWGPMIHGHAHPAIVAGVQQAAELGLSYGAPTAAEVKLANKICQLVPSVEMVRMVNSGTEATMSAIRLARGYTNKPYIIKFAGCYHGHSDSLLVQSGSGILTCQIPSSVGVLPEFVAHTLVADFNDLVAVTKLFQQYPDEIAAIIVEPIAGNMNCVLPQPDFLPGLRELCDTYHSLLIFDEVMTGFRVALGGAQALYDICPDLTTFGKIIGGGMPVGAFGGRRDVMAHLAPLGTVYQAGTLSGNPLAMTAGLIGLELLERPDFYEQLYQQTEALMTGLAAIAAQYHIPFSVQYQAGMFGFYFSDAKHINTLTDVKTSNIERFNRFFHGMLAEGVYFAPSAFEAGFLSSAHDSNIIDKTLACAAKVMQNL